MGSGEDDILHIIAGRERQPLRPVSELERRQVVSELQLARQRLELQQPSRVPAQLAYFQPSFI